MIYMEYVNVGKIYTTHGLNGEVKVKSNFNYKDKIYVNGFNFYIGKDKEGKIYFGSELKALEGFCDEYEVFLPGHYFYSKEGKMKRWYSRGWTEYETVKENDAQTEDVKVALEEAVHRQLMSDVPYGV